jgi:histidinol dehydrogenase
MRIIKGYNKAKLLLTRTVPLDYSSVSKSPGSNAENKSNSVEQTVRNIIADVQSKGDQALFKYTRNFDKVTLTSLEVGKEEISLAYSKVDRKLVSALKFAAGRIRKFHIGCKQKLDKNFLIDGVGRLVRPL